ncbi:ATP-binding protein [Sphingobacterium griseoflavum]|uniref:histidine kinase n=1 Tax=Sphingobacterium griseoflavum TaxID=1474952 RepID=A0ABQ3HX00_9SPHI|nr:ATP-binding protein [Sphingobacterium griseoflavum]GHE42010.1 two-component hybrid sensor and regulator [Sphingobacterium griseoflavum]
MSTEILESTEQFLLGGGEMAKLIRGMDWSKTPLGAIESWPQSLRTSVSLCLSSSFPILIAWGPEKIQIYNDSYRPICGAKHPESMGMNFRICWETALEVVGDAFTKAEQEGEGTYINDQRMFLDRYGYLEEAFMTFSFAPIRDESGGVGGIFHPITETTVKMLSGRRTYALRELGAALGKTKSIDEIGLITTDKYEDYELDIPFLLLYQLNRADETAALLAASGLAEESNLSPHLLDLATPDRWSLSMVQGDDTYLQLDDLQDRFGDFRSGPYPEAPRSAMVLPLRITGQEELFGFLIAGVSARRSLDEEYLNFYDQLRNTYNTALSSVYAYEQEQKRAEALAEIDRSKTAFFSNVSHEFRTPLTLMLGPLEDVLQGPHATEAVKQSLTAVHRNAERLLKLVNNLLDYSRVEAGRMQAVYQKVSLAAITADLASSFRSIIEKAGMQLLVSCPGLTKDTYVDRQMWEKIVLNLLSNAFKYTMEGHIAVQLREEGPYAVLQVSDTGIGIPQKELPYMFERFHRVENAAGRTHEGSGIGLSLVHELISLHKGSIQVSSEEGVGSTFTVKIPFGNAHLPSEKLVQEDESLETNSVKGAFLQEAISLLEEDAMSEQHGITAVSESNAMHTLNTVDTDAHILIVDDNADMRTYLRRLIEPHFKTSVAVHGADALQKIAQLKPDLVLSDIMMPIMDGKGMLREIRNHSNTSNLPVIFLSARAGEEARIDGLEAGADDYLVKPFSSAELLTKISAQIKISKARDHAEKQLRRILLNAPVAIAVYKGEQHCIEIANHRMLEYWGRTLNEVAGKPLFDVLPELVPQGLDIIMDAVYATGNRFVDQKKRITLARGGIANATYINLTIEALMEPDGRIIGIIAVAADVTDLVLANEEIEKASDTLALALDAANLGIWQTDWGTNNLFLSDNARNMYGIDVDTTLSFSEMLAIIMPDRRPDVLQAIERAVETKGNFSEAYQIQPVGGTKRKWIHSTGKVEMDTFGNGMRVVGTSRDITEEMEDDQRKSDFISMVSHEMKTPLTSVSAFTQVLQAHAKRQADVFAIDKLDRIYRQAKKMNSLISGFLDVARLKDSGKIRLNATRYQLNDVVREVLRDIGDVYATHELHFEPAEEVELQGDRDKIGSVISNLIGNAIKYSPAQTTVTVSTLIHENSVVFACSDRGIGIKEEDITRLFDRFYRADSQLIEHIGGFGIGLYICAEIVKKHQGEIWAESVFGQGSTFYVRLPR